MTVHFFDDTADAYGSVQCRDQEMCDILNQELLIDETMFLPIEQGDTLVIMSEGVVGLAQCWPTAITKKHGELHGMKDGYTVSGMLEEFDIGERKCGDRLFSDEQIAQAVAVARALDLPVADYI